MKRKPKYLYEVGIEYFRKEVYECELCNKEMADYYDYNNLFICPDCAFKLSVIDEKEYISTLPICLEHTKAIVYKGEIYISLNGEKYQFEKSEQDYRKTKKYQIWRESVFKRDNFQCQICGKIGGKLNAHHIKKYIDYPSLRFDIKNGITLCEKCHKKLHKELRKDGRQR